MKTTSSNPQTYRKDKINKINEFINKMPTEDEVLKEKTKRGLFKNLLQDPLIQEAQKERRLDRMTSLTPEKLERMNQLFLQEEFENAKEKAQAFVYETEEEYDARVNKTIAKMEKEFEKKKENLSESELKLFQGYEGIEDGKIMRYKEQAKTNKEYINDPSLQKNLIKIEHPIQKFFYVNESRLDAKKEGNGKNYKETNFIVTLPSNSKRNNTDLYRELFKEKRTNKEEKYGVRAGGYIQVDPIGKTITFMRDGGSNETKTMSPDICYILEKQFPGYIVDSIAVPERNHGSYRGILNPNQYFGNTLCDGSFEDYMLLGKYLEMADSSLIENFSRWRKEYMFGAFSYRFFLEAYVNVLEKSLSNDPDGKELLKLKEKSINGMLADYPFECKEFDAKIKEAEKKHGVTIDSGFEYARALIINKAKSLNKINDIKLIDVFNECMNVAAKKYADPRKNQGIRPWIDNNASNKADNKYVVGNAIDQVHSLLDAKQAEKEELRRNGY